MLLFIEEDETESEYDGNFNTSHVTVYHGTDRLTKFVSLFQYISCYCLSKKFCLQSYQCTLFQYISCYCLSCWHFSNAINCFDFNTSHVTVYRYPNTFHVVHTSFQYISCYCLSLCFIVCCVIIVFQYISCYCLSHLLAHTF